MPWVVSHWQALPVDFRASALLALQVGCSGNGVSLVWSKDRGNDRDQQEASNDTQSHPHWQLIDVSQEHLGPHENEDSRQPVMEVVKESHHASQGKVESTQSENRKDIRSVHDKGIPCDTQDGRNRVHRKDNVCRLHHQEHNEERCSGVMSSLLHEEMVGVVVRCHGYQATEELEHWMLVRMDLFLFLSDHFDAGQDEQGAEDIEDPVQPLEQRNAS